MGDVEARLERIFAEALGLVEVGLDQDIFALGADSLRAIQLLARVREEFGVELTLDELFAAPTVAQLALVLAGIGDPGEIGEDATQPIRRSPEACGEPLPLSSAQRRLWFLHQLEPHNPVHNLAAAVRLTGH